jgi:two-component system, response regulator
LSAESVVEAMDYAMTAYILLVDDDAGDAMVTKKALRDNHIVNDVVVVRDGAQACDFLFAGGRGDRPMPQIVLLDFTLPTISGLEVFERIRNDERTQRIPTVLLTANKHDEDLLEGRRLGSKCYVRKPLDFTEFAQTVRQLGLSWLILSEPS